MTRQKETLTIIIPPGGREKLEAIARRLGIFWGKTPSPSGLIAAIAENRLEVGNRSFNESQVAALRQAATILIDSGYITQAQIILALLLDRGNLEEPTRLALLEQFSNPSQAWRLAIDRYIHDRQPFRLFYTDAQKRQLEYSVYYAQINFHEKRFYVDIWCEETEDLDEFQRSEFPDLAHNRTLRLDRIKTMFPIDGEWRDSLDYLKVHLQFSGGLVKAYEAKNEDISDETVDNVRKVVRKVSNPFWLIREILPYGKNCIVLAPESIKRKVQEELRAICQLYES